MREAREGASVACADRDAGAAEATAVLVRDEGQAAAVVLADVTAPEACASVIAESAAALGGNDGLVLNVGIGVGRGMAGTTAAQWDHTFAVNTKGALPGGRGRADGAGARFGDRVHQLGGEPASGDRDPGV